MGLCAGAGGGAKVSAREMSDGDEPCSLFGGPQRVAVSDSKRWTRDADEFLNTLNEAMINHKRGPQNHGTQLSIAYGIKANVRY